MVTNRLRRPSARLPLAGGGSLLPSGVSFVITAGDENPVQVKPGSGILRDHRLHQALVICGDLARQSEVRPPGGRGSQLPRLLPY